MDEGSAVDFYIIIRYIEISIERATSILGADDSTKEDKRKRFEMIKDVNTSTRKVITDLDTRYEAGVDRGLDWILVMLDNISRTTEIIEANMNEFIEYTDYDCGNAVFKNIGELETLCRYITIFHDEIWPRELIEGKCFGIK